MKFLIFSSFLYLLSIQTKGNELNFFDLGINFWNPKQDTVKKEEKTPSKSNFNWDAFKNPNNKEFFKEGDYTPPEPFMALVRNPSDENLQQWFEYMNLKNQLSKRLESRMEEYVKKNNLSKSEQEAVTKDIKKVAASQADSNRLRFRMYFDSKCPFCQKMFSTLNYFQNLGYFVEARQIDSGQLLNVPVAVTYASKEEITKYNITNVPLLLVGDLKEKKVFRLTGYHSPEEILRTIQ